MRKSKIVASLLMLLVLISPISEAKKKKVKKTAKRPVPHHIKCSNIEPVPLLGAFGMQSIVNEMNRKANAGVVVKSLSSGQILYQQHANEAMTPASNMKVITGYAALKFLGPNYRFQTRLMTDAGSRVVEGVLEGNLYLQYSGDPSLQLSDLDHLFDTLNTHGIHAIRGRLLIDTSRFVNEGSSPGTVESDESYCYGAPVSTAILERNCLTFKIAPTRAGQTAQVVFPYNVPLPVNNHVITKSSRHCHPNLLTQADGRYHLEGCVSSASQAVSMTAVVMPDSHFGEQAAARMVAKKGIQVLGECLPVASVETLQVLEGHVSAPLSSLVVEMMKRSDNLIANTLYKTVGALYHHQSATWQSSGEAVKAILHEAGVDTNGMVIIDGSGLSRDNRLTPMQLIQVLMAAYQDPEVSPYFLQALPVGGLDGTLKHRMGMKDVIGKVKAKTGTMQGVSSLSGYVETNTGELLVFSIIVNDFSGGAYVYRSLQDRFCRVMRLSY